MADRVVNIFINIGDEELKALGPLARSVAQDLQQIAVVANQIRQSLGASATALANTFKASASAIRELNQAQVQTSRQVQAASRAELEALRVRAAEEKRLRDEQLGRIRVQREQLALSREQSRQFQQSAADLAAIAAVARTVSNSLIGVSTGAANAFIDVERNLNTFEAVTSATQEEIAVLADELQRLGIETSKAPGEISNLAAELGRIGFTSREVVDSLEGIVRASEASGESLGRAGEIIAISLRQFGEEADQAARFADVLVFTSNNAATNINQLGEALKFTATSANNANQDVETTTAALAALADVGLRGGIAGRNLQALFTSLTALSPGAAAAVDDLNIALREADGTFRQLPDIVRDFQAAFEGLDQQNIDETVNEIFGIQGGRAFLALLQDGADGLEEFEAALRAASGTAVDAAEIQLQGLTGALQLLSGSTEALQEDLFSFVAGPIEALVRSLTFLVNAFLELPDPIRAVASVLITLATAFTTATVAAIAFQAALGTLARSGVFAAVATSATQLIGILGTLTGIIGGLTLGVAALVLGINEIRVRRIEAAARAANNLTDQLSAAAQSFQQGQVITRRQFEEIAASLNAQVAAGTRSRESADRIIESLVRQQNETRKTAEEVEVFTRAQDELAESLDNTIQAIERQNVRLLELRASGAISDEELAERQTQLRRRRLNAELSAVREQLQNELNLAGDVTNDRIELREELTSTIIGLETELARTEVDIRRNAEEDIRTEIELTTEQAISAAEETIDAERAITDEIQNRIAARNEEQALLDSIEANRQAQFENEIAQLKSAIETIDDRIESEELIGVTQRNLERERARNLERIVELEREAAESAASFEQIRARSEAATATDTRAAEASQARVELGVNEQRLIELQQSLQDAIDSGNEVQQVTIARQIADVQQANARIAAQLAQIAVAETSAARRTEVEESTRALERSTERIERGDTTQPAALQALQELIDAASVATVAEAQVGGPAVPTPGVTAQPLRSVNVPGIADILAVLQQALPTINDSVNGVTTAVNNISLNVPATTTFGGRI